MPDVATIYDICHLHAGAQFVSLRLHRKNGNLAGLEIICDLLRQIGQRTRSQVFQYPRALGEAKLFQLMHDAGGNLFRTLIRNYCDLLVGLNSQAHVDRIAGAGSKFRIESQCAELLVGLSGGKAHYPTFLAEATDSVKPAPFPSIIYSPTFFTSPVSSKNHNCRSAPPPRSRNCRS